MNNRQGLIAKHNSPNCGALSVFDSIVIFFLMLVAVAPGFLKPSIFVFGSMFITLVSIYSKPVRGFHSRPLAFLGALSIISMIYHNWIFPRGSIVDLYINWSIMNEGFIYIFCGITLIYGIVRHASNTFQISRFLTLIILFWFLSHVLYTWSMTPILALFIALIVVSVNAGHSILAFLLSSAALVVVIQKWNWILFKFACRPVAWKYAWGEILSSKMLGAGFSQKLTGADGMIYPAPYGGIYRHNDYLELAVSLGVIGTGLVLGFIWETFKDAKPSYVCTLSLAAVIMCAFQRTMFYPVHASVIITLFALLIIEKKGRLTTSPQKVGG